MKGTRGLSLIEMVVAIGILAVVVMSSSTLIVQFVQAQKMVSSRDETNEFIVAFTRFFQDPTLCKTALTQGVPISLTSTLAAISIPNFNAYNNDAYILPNVPPPLGAGYLVSKNIRIQSLQLMQKAAPVSAPAFEFAYTMGGNDYYRTIAQLRLVTEIFDPAVPPPGTLRAHPARHFEIPVITQGNNLPAPIADCLGALSMDSACLAAGGKPVAGICDMTATGSEKCKNRGSYIEYNDDDGGDTYQNMPSPNPLNPLTNAANCPTGSIDIPTGRRDWTNSYSCGKKCTATVNYHEVYHTCLAC